MTQHHGYRFETLAVKGGIELEPGDEVAPPIHLSATFVNPGATELRLNYARSGGPGYDVLEKVLAQLEGGNDAVVFNAGQAVLVAILADLPAGSTVVMPTQTYFGFKLFVDEFAPRFGLTIRTVEQADLQAVGQALNGAALLWVETPTNPTMEVADLAAIGALAAAKGVPWVCDNTFASPVLQRPLDFGAMVSLHSVTKYIAGHSDLILGVGIVKDLELSARLRKRRSSFAVQPDGFSCWLARRGIQTLPLRVKHQCAAAMEIATRLSKHPGVAQVYYPGLPTHPGHEIAASQMKGGFGGMLSFLTVDPEAAVQIPFRCKVWVPGTSLGSVESLIERRARWAGEEVDPRLLRLSVGVENVEDLWEDLDQAIRG